MPTTSWPWRLSSAAVTDESTPPDMATTMREPFSMAGLIRPATWNSNKRLARGTRHRQIIQERQLVKAGGDLQGGLQLGLVQRQLGGSLGHVGLLDIRDEPRIERG